MNILDFVLSNISIGFTEGASRVRTFPWLDYNDEVIQHSSLTQIKTMLTRLTDRDKECKKRSPEMEIVFYCMYLRWAYNVGGWV